MNKISKNREYGFKSFDDIPDQNFLDEYYSEKYFDENKNYSEPLKPIEIEWANLEARFLLDHLDKLGIEKKGKIVEIGCGQGFLVSNAVKRNFDIVGLDFSLDQLHNPDDRKSEVYNETKDPIGHFINSDYDCSCVIFKHVIEHVPSPINLIKKISDRITRGTLLVIECPSDFSILQDYLLDAGKIKEEYWVTYPDHLSYFSPKSMTNLLGEKGFETIDLYGDFPIETLLFSGEFNYVSNKSKNGKAAHYMRCETMKFLYENVKYEHLIKLFRSWAECSLARSFTTISRKQ